MEIRRMAAADDRMAISRVFEESWKYAYRGIVPQEYLDSLPEGRWADQMDDPERNTLLCVEGARIVGVVCFCRSRLEAFADWGEISAIYLLPEYMGKGFGRAMMEAALAELRVMGYHRFFLWVFEENARSRRFYEKAGFSFAGEAEEKDISGKVLRLVRYARVE